MKAQWAKLTPEERKARTEKWTYAGRNNLKKMSKQAKKTAMRNMAIRQLENLELDIDVLNLSTEEILSITMTERWKQMGDLIREAQSEGTTKAWADPVKKAARLEKCDRTARAKGFRDRGHQMSCAGVKKTAEYFGMTPQQFVDLPKEQRARLTSQKRREMRQKRDTV